MAHGGDIYRNKVNMDFSVNLNPMGVSKEVFKEVEKSLERISCYPDIRQAKAREIIAKALGVKAEEVCGGNGASELIMAAARAIKPQKALLFEPAFGGYEYALKAADCDIDRLCLKRENGFKFTMEDVARLSLDCDIAFVCDPVNPTGAGISDEVLLKLLEVFREKNITVCLDESFLWLSDKSEAFGQEHFAKLIDKYPNLIIIRSLTKILAMPGIRMGIAVASSGNIEKMIKQLPEWNLSAPAEAGIMAGIKLIYETDFSVRCVKEITSEREYLTKELRELGLKTYDSCTAFILFEGPKDLYERALEKGILIRDCSDFCGLSDGYYRIAVRRHEDNKELIRILRGIINEF
jgi:threonine-phosphate decarboxylase